MNNIKISDKKALSLAGFGGGCELNVSLARAGASASDMSGSLELAYALDADKYSGIIKLLRIVPLSGHATARPFSLSLADFDEGAYGEFIKRVGAAGARATSGALKMWLCDELRFTRSDFVSFFNFDIDAVAKLARSGGVDVKGAGDISALLNKVLAKKSGATKGMPCSLILYDGGGAELTIYNPIEAQFNLAFRGSWD